MKLTEENADYMDCRPDFDKNPINIELVPDHLRARVLGGRTARGAKAPSPGPLDDPVRGK
jgi:hypothetical protein